MPSLPDDIPATAVVVPIPPARGRRPGPHLATMLARTLARRHHLAFQSLLRTTRLAAEQHRLTIAERRANVEGLFICRKKAPDQVVLVDDLLTSGATASSAAAALQEAGTKRVILVCLARTPRRGENDEKKGLVE
jgi:predicted amidophosphoribosyltransferase